MVVFLANTYVKLDAEGILSFVIVMIFLLGPVNMISNLVRDLTKAKVILAKLSGLDILNDVVGFPEESEKQQSLDGSDNLPYGEFRKLELERIEFSYKLNLDSASIFHIGPFDLTVGRGEIVFLVGGSGSGKTTIANILLGLFKAQKGSIKLNGKLINSSNVAEYLEYFSSVFAEFYLFDEVVSKKGDVVPDKAIAEMLSTLKLSDIVKVRNQKLSTTRLSKGQRKRLALLISYFENADIYI